MRAGRKLPSPYGFASGLRRPVGKMGPNPADVAEWLKARDL